MTTEKELWKDLKKIFNNYGSFSSSLFTNIQMWYPLDDPRILFRLKGEDETEDIYEYLRSTKKHELLKLFKEYHKYIANPSMNPRKSYEPLEYWIEPEDVTQKFDAQILEFLGEDYTHIFYVGEKGCGKTLTQNCWLHTKNKDLEDRKIFWVRCDGYKLYKLWYDPNLDKKKGTSLEDYLNLQLVYVFAKYYNQNPFFEKIFNQLRQDNVKFPYMPGKVHDHKIANEMASFFEKFSRDIEGYEFTKALNKKSSYAIYILREAQAERTGIDRARWNLLSLSRYFQNFLLKNGYKILKIVDGIDNINLVSSEALPYYKHMISEVAQFIYTNSTPDILKIVALRERTKIDIERARLGLVDNLRDDIHPVPIKHSTPPFREISNKRWGYIKNKIKKIKFISNIPSSFLIYPSFYLIDNRLEKINNCYHNNIATFLHNTFSLFMTVYYRWLQLNKTEDFSYENYIQIFRSRNFFLNGRFYLNSKVNLPDTTKKGVFAFNIFHSQPNCNATFISRRWQGLCTTRILQLLINIPSNYKISENQTIEYLENWFGYTLKQIKFSLNLCRNFGLVDTKMDEDEDKIYLEISKKGKYVLHLIFSDLDVLYTLALDTYLPSSFQDLIAVHCNRIHKETYYPSSAIITSILFILFLIYVHNKEMNLLSQTNESGSIPFDPKNFDLPFNIQRILKRSLRLYKLANRNEKQKIAMLIQKLNELRIQFNQ